jgi:hypothetical protein
MTETIWDNGAIEGVQTGSDIEKARSPASIEGSGREEKTYGVSDAKPL